MRVSCEVTSSCVIVYLIESKTEEKAREKNQKWWRTTHSFFTHTHSQLPKSATETSEPITRTTTVHVPPLRRTWP